MIQRRSRCGNFWDNAPTERFVEPLKQSGCREVATPLFIRQPMLLLITFNSTITG